MPFPNPATQFKPGQSGNPGGHSRRRRLLAELTDLIEEKNAWRGLAAVWLKMALDGDYQFFREFLIRNDGLPAQKLEIEQTVDHTGDLPAILAAIGYAPAGSETPDRPQQSAGPGGGQQSRPADQPAVPETAGSEAGQFRPGSRAPAVAAAHGPDASAARQIDNHD